ncbi:uncharacterized protein G2W53_019303 [Senna tora]|uniref:Uncharacterized protein n=1 Tax=Senna tora TaxID=362788 RepID=A0A834WRX6_9FABA|nr:uncharacterized protein G2W53_019303 [Senna tora]
MVVCSDCDNGFVEEIELNTRPAPPGSIRDGGSRRGDDMVVCSDCDNGFVEEIELNTCPARLGSIRGDVHDRKPPLRFKSNPLRPALRSIIDTFGDEYGGVVMDPDTLAGTEIMRVVEGGGCN